MLKELLNHRLHDHVVQRLWMYFFKLDQRSKHQILERSDESAYVFFEFIGIPKCLVSNWSQPIPCLDLGKRNIFQSAPLESPKSYTLEKTNGWKLKVPRLKRKIIWTKLFFLDSVLIFQGVNGTYSQMPHLKRFLVEDYYVDWFSQKNRVYEPLLHGPELTEWVEEAPNLSCKDGVLRQPQGLLIHIDHKFMGSQRATLWHSTISIDLVRTCDRSTLKNIWTNSTKTFHLKQQRKSPCQVASWSADQ